jgi:hypothetical protein
VDRIEWHAVAGSCAAVVLCHQSSGEEGGEEAAEAEGDVDEAGFEIGVAVELDEES